MSKPLRTKKQRIVMGIILREAGQGHFRTISELHAMLPYTCHYGSFRCTLDALEAHGSIVKERAGMSVLIKPTHEGYGWFSPSGA